MIITAIDSFAKPARISDGVRILKIPRMLTAITKVKEGPRIPQYREIRMKIMTINTRIKSKLFIFRILPF